MPSSRRDGCPPLRRPRSPSLNAFPVIQSAGRPFGELGIVERQNNKLIRAPAVMDASERRPGVGTAAQRHPRHHLPLRDGLIGRAMVGEGGESWDPA